MKNTIFYLISLILFSCSNIRKTERRADKGSVQDCYRVVEFYNAHKYYTPVTKEQEEKIIKYSIKGLSLDTNFCNRYFFHKELAYYSDDRIKKYYNYKKAAELEDGEAQWIVGLYYLEGQKQEINNDSAMYWLKKASCGNYYQFAALANNELGNIYSNSKIISKDTILSIYYYKKACACFGIYSHKPSCDKVVSYYKSHPALLDTSEVSIYSELSRQLGTKNATK